MHIFLFKKKHIKKTYENKLLIFEWQILRKIFGPTKKYEEYRYRYNTHTQKIKNNLASPNGALPAFITMPQLSAKLRQNNKIIVLFC